MFRVRFAPSPTGYLHIGGLRTCLYNWLFVRKNKGRLILRIEDTDRERFIEGATENIIKTLETMGLNWDEGPMLAMPATDKHKCEHRLTQIKHKGKYGPYIQSQRLHIYQNLAQKLIDDGFAYYCFCTPGELEKMRQKQLAKKQPPIYDGRCRKLTEKQIEEKLKDNKSYVIRLKVPEKAPKPLKGSEWGIVKFNDLIRNEVEFDLKKIDDQILLKSDGWPTYHLANVVDDHLMGITHVIRGEEWLPSVPKHLLIYQAFGWQPPEFAHLPLLLNPDRSKLSKRQGDVAVEEYLAKGYLPEALLNFIALLGWSAQGPSGRSGSAHERSEMSGNPREEEIFSIKELIQKFSLEKIQKAGAIFDRQKLDWMNGCYIRKMDLEELTRLCISYLVKWGLIKPFFISKQYPPAYGGYTLEQEYIITKTKEEISCDKLKKIIALEQERLKRLDEIGKRAEFFFVDRLDYNPKILVWENMDFQQVKQNLILIRQELEKLSTKKFKTKFIQIILNQLAQKQGSGEIFWPFRVALSGKEASPPPAEIAEILGKEKTIRRIEQAINKLINCM